MVYIQTKIAKSLSQKNESKNENNFTQMSNHLKYEDPTLSNQQAASATQLLQNGGNSKSGRIFPFLGGICRRNIRNGSYYA
jgi:hypothetical protein